MALAAAMNAPIERAGTKVVRTDGSRIVRPTSEAIGNKAREILAALGEHISSSGELRSGTLDATWKPALVKAMTACQLGQKTGVGSVTLAFTDKHCENLAKMVKRQPLRLADAARRTWGTGCASRAPAALPRRGCRLSAWRGRGPRSGSL